MSRFNLLLIGDANHQYIINFTKWLRTVLPNISISIISTSQNIRADAVNSNYDNVYLALSNTNYISKIKGLRILYMAWNTYRIIKIKRLGANAILVHFVVPWFAIISKHVKKRTQNLSVAIWGSDFYRAKNKNNLNKILNYADNIIIDSPQTIQDFKVEFVCHMQKVKLCYFGNEPIENLKYFKETSVTRQQSCIYFKFSNEKLNLTIGHNGSIAHQHIKIIKALLYMGPESTSKIRIILPMTYGLNANYLKEVESACKSTNIEYKIFTDFMTENDVAHLRNLTDIMVNLQTTDTFSGSMKEVLYCGSLVINGDWLPYQFLKELEIYFEEVNSVEELPEKLNKVISDYNYYKMQCIGNPSRIYDISSWSKVITKWKEVIELQR